MLSVLFSRLPFRASRCPPSLQSSVVPPPRSGSHLRRRPQALLQRWLEILAIVLRLLLWPLRQLTAFLFPTHELDGLSPAVASKAAQSFVNYVRSVSPNSGANVEEAWSTNGFAATMEEASQNGSLLLLYLHSPLHRSADTYCRKVLCHDALKSFLLQPNVMALGLSIHSGQGGQLAELLKATSYPVLALMQPPPRAATSSSQRTSMTLLLRVEGAVLINITADQLVPHLQPCLTRHQTILAEQEARRYEREQEVLLRQQQDAEYQAGLEADQARELAKLEVEAEAERQRCAEEERVAEEARQTQGVLDQAKEHLREPPASGGAMIRFVLPSGTKLNRRFHADDSIATLKAFVRLNCHEKNMDMGEIGLSTNFPKNSYNEDQTLTLEEVGLLPQAVLMVQDLDA